LDGYKRVKGRKRQLVVDTMGLPIRMRVYPANEHDTLGGQQVLKSVPWTARLCEIRADQGYESAALANWCKHVLGAILSISQPDPNQKGFVVQKGRWVVERTFAWLGRYRRLSKDYEQSPLMSESFLCIAAIHLLVRRLSR
jgi:putative transposase